VDVAKEELEVCVMPGEHRITVARNDKGIAAFLKFCKEHGAECVIVESTGGSALRKYQFVVGVARCRARPFVFTRTASITAATPRP
jgi:hypothetical protein